jgi:tetratricopeptide (TPR) repeat protein
LVEAGKAGLPGVLAETAADPLRLDDAIAALRRYSLVDVSGDSCSVHRLVQAITRADLGAEGSEARWAEAAVRTIAEAFPFKEDDVATWGRSGRLLPHAFAAAGHAERCGAALDTAGRLLNQAGLYLRLRAQWDEAEEALRRALKIGERVFGPDHPEVAIRANNIGTILKVKGDLDGALRYTQRALEIDERVYGPEHPEVATYANNIGQILHAKGDLDGALRYSERSLEIDERTYGPDHPNVAMDFNNIGQILQDKGDLDGALRHIERALSIAERVFGPDHPTTRLLRDNLLKIKERIAQKKKG